MKTLILAYIIVLFSCSKKNEISNNDFSTAQTSLNVSYGNLPQQNMDVYLPAGRNTSTTKTMILIHGGAWASGDKSDFTSFVDSLKKRFTDYAFFNVNYRLATGFTNFFPTQENDIKSCVEFIYNKRNEYGISDKFVLLGGSAGAHLALLQAYKYHSPVHIRAVVDFFGPTDMVALYNNPGSAPQGSVALVVGATPTSNPSIYQQSSPINFVNAQSSPTIILHGALDDLVAPSQSENLKNKLVQNNIPTQYILYANGGHADWDLATYTDAFNKIQAFLKVHVN